MLRSDHLFTAAATCMMISLVLAMVSVSATSDLLPIQAAHHSGDTSVRIVGTYEAPLIACETPLRIPDEYIVFLRFGYTLDQHKRTVGNVDLDSAVDLIFPESHLSGTYYSTALSHDSLVAVRADAGVDKVECNFRPLAIEAVEMEREL